MTKVEDYEELESYIKKHELNNIFSNDVRKYMSLYMFNKNDYICRENEHLESMFFLVEGKAKVSKHLENGKSLLISFYSPLTIIGDVEFVRDRKTDCSVQAIKNTYCIGIKFEVVRLQLTRDCKFLLKICDYLSEKLRNGSNNSSINLLYPLENRLASYIVAFTSFGAENEKIKKFMFRENYGEIAELLGTSYRHLNRTLNKLCFDKILKKQGKEYIIEDFPRLMYLAGELYK